MKKTGMDEKEMAEGLNSFFGSVFTHENEENVPKADKIETVAHGRSKFQPGENQKED